MTDVSTTWAEVIIRVKSSSNDDFRSGCRNVSHCHRQQSFSGLPSPGRSHYTIDCHSRVQTLYWILLELPVVGGFLCLEGSISTIISRRTIFFLFGVTALGRSNVLLSVADSIVNKYVLTFLLVTSFPRYLTTCFVFVHFGRVPPWVQLAISYLESSFSSTSGQEVSESVARFPE